MTGVELERLLVARFGEDFREKVIVTAVGSFALRDAFDECGLRDPRARPAADSYGIWQMTSVAGRGLV